MANGKRVASYHLSENNGMKLKCSNRETGLSGGSRRADSVAAQ